MATVAQFAAPQGAARSQTGLRGPRFRWTSQEPTKVATVAQFAAPEGREVSTGSAYNSTPLDLPGAHERGDR